MNYKNICIFRAYENEIKNFINETFCLDLIFYSFEWFRFWDYPKKRESKQG